LDLLTELLRSSRLLDLAKISEKRDNVERKGKDERDLSTLDRVGTLLWSPSTDIPYENVRLRIFTEIQWSCCLTIAAVPIIP
jgi:hypothetical protein